MVTTRKRRTVPTGAYTCAIEAFGLLIKAYPKWWAGDVRDFHNVLDLIEKAKDSSNKQKLYGKVRTSLTEMRRWVPARDKAFFDKLVAGVWHSDTEAEADKNEV
jgi:hypothetical protein